ncbi:Undecaprenyl diphosphate synthase [Metschnikowia bicuspidata var. bicuspidata NRRL YB-4993]|uniref:ditrans,polycis-polyprenyl diphosphate synthase [(2E,6E)-farnesyldiphosphate specific] n=1 Tax=Metschnikowia bicuspidata var. bicuspidata NRRL YB-4993 TaxID=869754 RepID=A0A1A0HK39_9ASCO|nr:Undecaprenyl diphosphate synthase [Metschnikowia bicuspidata var. bicuspidata NRRL YB-4993]OBA24252.1 Undecaprenyl diphosphate synthase [Metschnikowia bicuspidata var. bicuspidata NRRL YB-4993]
MHTSVQQPPPAAPRLVLFYPRYAVLLAVFFVLSILRNVQFVYNKLRLRVFSMTYFPNNSPRVIRDDVNKLLKIPRRVSCIVNLRSDDDENGGVQGVIADISELAAWTLSLGIPSLTIYEYNGAVKSYLPELQRYISKNLLLYFGNPAPSFTIRVPHSNITLSHGDADAPDLEISLLSRVDGKPTIVELTKTISELSANKELSVDDITVDLIDEELVELVGPEPDLLICFGPVLDLQDYPPWHIRLSEMYWEPDNNSVNYAVFIRALQKYAHAKVNLGK